jgi:hypothetical protein
MIRNAVLHLDNEQPLLADVYRLPEPADVGLLCTNVRTLNGKRPVFIDDSASVFYFPYRVIRFVEIPPASVGIAAAPPSTEGAAVPGEAGEPAADLELDEELLRRVREI